MKERVADIDCDQRILWVAFERFLAGEQSLIGSPECEDHVCFYQVRPGQIRSQGDSAVGVDHRFVLQVQIQANIRHQHMSVNRSFIQGKHKFSNSSRLLELIQTSVCLAHVFQNRQIVRMILGCFAQDAKHVCRAAFRQIIARQIDLLR